ncbi:PXMP2/4 family protein 3 [Fulvia fulva]|uniref:PXMP2/4 family protein 3 n=1 Tax=Passalora fulva TaxID=5499 RepID=A0A9Q8P4U9_PASFU|nr:PXMP2/4 family protein 3 [Fulvia fulva]KAK4631124.1 PXMP2/4 family protein 3 [Fulvia fulva]KAK4632798.1 PXMP2/4 family protein 3 [Fulvia fulva]UJO13097.1 PXMP2/4 family protein 3 [Fulvia fulva]WPV11848.1 PXMP2/4 family protein 3 [Fulvia fulva]WPV26941.1 PXMP2/4 family protein 3 [Fulvia fulva]
MSQVKFEQKETIRTTSGAGGSGGPPSGGKEDFAHKVGDALTKGSGPNGYLAWYLKKLQEDPLRTKMITSGTLAGLQEFLASWIAKDRSKHGHYFTSRVPKMAVYGAFISAPLGHVMISILQKMFAGRTSLRAKIMQIIVSNLIISPIQNAVYLTSMAIIAGARTFHQIRATVRAGFMPVMKVSWVTSPLALAFAQAFLPNEVWVPFFNAVGFIIGTYINAHTKKKRLQALRRKYQDSSRTNDGRDGRDGRSEYGGSRPGPGAY